MKGLETFNLKDHFTPWLKEKKKKKALGEKVLKNKFTVPKKKKNAHVFGGKK